jgi:hypothetical protein
VRGEIRINIYQISNGLQHSCHHEDWVSPQFECCHLINVSNEKRIPTLAAMKKMDEPYKT